MLDTHHYDGRIDTSNLSSISASTEEKKKACEKFLTLNLNEGAKHFLTIIINDMDTNSNYDPTNKLKAGDILYKLLIHVDNADFVKQLEEQLLDLRTGACPQGRSTRLFQLLSAFT